MIWVLGRTGIQGPGVFSSRLSPRTLRTLSLSSPRSSRSPSSRPASSLSPIYATHPPSTFSDQDVDTFRGSQGNLWHNNVLDERARLRRIDQLRIKLAPPGAARSRVLVSRGRIIAENEAKREGEEGAVWVEGDEKMVVWVDLPPREGSENGQLGEEMGERRNRHSILTSPPSYDQPQPSPSFPPWTPNPSLQPRPLPPHDPTNPHSILYNPRSTHSPFLPSTLTLPPSPSYPPLLLLPNHLYKHLPSVPPPFPTLDMEFFQTLLDPNAPPSYEPTPLGKLDLSVPPVGRGAQPVLRMGRERIGVGMARGEEAVHPKRVQLGREGWEVVERLGRRFLGEGEGEGIVGRTGEGKEEEAIEERKDLGEWVEEVRRLQGVEREGTRGVADADASRGSNFSSMRLPPPPPPPSPSPSNPAYRLSAQPQDVTSTISTSSQSERERVPPTFTHFVVDSFTEELSAPPASPPPSRYQSKPVLSQVRSTARNSSPKPNRPTKLQSKPFAFLGSTTLVPSSPTSALPTTSIKPTPTSTSSTKSKQLHLPTQPKTARWKLDDASPSHPTPASSNSTPAVTPTPTTSTTPATLASVSLHPHSQTQTKPQPKPTRQTVDTFPSFPTPKSTRPSSPSLDSKETGKLYLSFLLPPSTSSSTSSSSDDASTRLKEIVRSKLPSLAPTSSPTAKPKPGSNVNLPSSTSTSASTYPPRISLRKWWEGGKG